MFSSDSILDWQKMTQTLAWPCLNCFVCLPRYTSYSQPRHCLSSRLFMCLPRCLIITLPLYPHALLLLASGALEGVAQTLPLKQLVLDHCYVTPPHAATPGIMATIGTITTLEKLCLEGSTFDKTEACEVSGLLSLACLLMTSPSHYCRHP